MSDNKPSVSGPQPTERLTAKHEFVQLQNSGKSLEHLHGGVTVSPLLQTQITIGADAREHRDFFASQPTPRTRLCLAPALLGTRGLSQCRRD